jgi:hypothetical protein
LRSWRSRSGPSGRGVQLRFLALGLSQTGSPMSPRDRKFLGIRLLLWTNPEMKNARQRNPQDPSCRRLIRVRRSSRKSALVSLCGTIGVAPAVPDGPEGPLGMDGMAGMDGAIQYAGTAPITVLKAATQLEPEATCG